MRSCQTDDASNTGSATSSLAQISAGLAIGDWRNASTTANLLGANGITVGAWGAPGNAVLDLLGQNDTLTSYYNGASGAAAQVGSHLSGLFGGMGYPVTTPVLPSPTLDQEPVGKCLPAI